VAKKTLHIVPLIDFTV